MEKGNYDEELLISKLIIQNIIFLQGICIKIQALK